MRSGFFNMETAADLARKLAHDYRLLAENPGDPYRAFNFFVTAEHLPEWMNRPALRKQTAELRVCSHLANGAKHITTLNPNRHTSVDRTEKEYYVEPGYTEDGYFADPLIVHFTEKEAIELGCQKMDVLSLAERVMRYWADYFPDILGKSA